MSEIEPYVINESSSSIKTDKRILKAMVMPKLFAFIMSAIVVPFAIWQIILPYSKLVFIFAIIVLSLLVVVYGLLLIVYFLCVMQIHKKYKDPTQSHNGLYWFYEYDFKSFVGQNITICKYKDIKTVMIFGDFMALQFRNEQGIPIVSVLKDDSYQKNDKEQLLLILKRNIDSSRFSIIKKG